MECSAPMHAYTVPLTPEAETGMAEIRREATDLLRAHRGTYATALFGRYAENTAKLAMIAAISRDPTEPVTQLRDVTWAGKLVEHCIGTLVREADRFVGVNDNEAGEEPWPLSASKNAPRRRIRWARPHGASSMATSRRRSVKPIPRPDDPSSIAGRWIHSA
jgi:hypothetical protein